MKTLEEKAAEFMEMNYPESSLVRGCFDVSILYDGIYEAFKAGYKAALSNQLDSNIARLELENTEFDYGHNIGYKSSHD